MSTVASGAEELLQRIREKSLHESIEALKTACDEAKQAWSGSNLGYHATVYYAGLQPKPPSVEFSSEWGLMDRWPTHQPNPGWRTMDGKEVEAAILRTAGIDDLKKLDDAISQLRREFFTLQATATSILSALVADKDKDAYLRNRLERAEKLIAPEADTIATSLANQGPGWSRDSLAATQGLKIAPHQRLVAHALAAAVLENGIEALGDVAKETVSHIRRIEPRKRQMSSSGSTIFIGHGASPLWRELKDFLKDRLSLDVDEFNRVSTAGIPTAVRLSELLDAASFAFLIMTGEDQQSDGKVRARENVVHEAGLFQGVNRLTNLTPDWSAPLGPDRLRQVN